MANERTYRNGCMGNFTSVLILQRDSGTVALRAAEEIGIVETTGEG